MRVIQRVFVAIAFTASVTLAQGGVGCQPFGAAINHPAPPAPSGLPGHIITFSGTLDLVSEAPGVCAPVATGCEFVFKADVLIQIQPPSTPTQGDLCLTTGGGLFPVICGPTDLPSVLDAAGNPIPGLYEIKFNNLALSADCGNPFEWTIGFYYQWVLLTLQQVFTAQITCSGC